MARYGAEFSVLRCAQLLCWVLGVILGSALLAAMLSGYFLAGLFCLCPLAIFVVLYYVFRDLHRKDLLENFNQTETLRK